MTTFFLVLLMVCTTILALSSPLSDKKLFTRDFELPNNIRDVRCLLSQGDTWVPVIGLQKSRSMFVSKRRSLFAAGVYPGVEYKLMNITVLNPSATTVSSGRTEVMTLQGLLSREFMNRAVTTTSSSNSNVTPVEQPVGQFFDRFYPMGSSKSNSNSNSQPVGQFFDQVLNSVVASRQDKNIIDNNNNDTSVISQEEESVVELTVAPAYPLIRGMERDWPVRIALSCTYATSIVFVTYSYLQHPLFLA